jgi:hypothetical protein
MPKQKKPRHLARMPVHRLLAKRQGERQVLYRKLSPLYGKFSKIHDSKEGRRAFSRAKAVADEVGRYSQNAKDQKWAKACVIVAAISQLPVEMAEDIRTSLKRFLPLNQTDPLVNSFMCNHEFSKLDRLAPDDKDKDRYKSLVRPYVSKEGRILLPPETFVRTILMSQISLDGLTDGMDKNVADSILRVWRPAAIQLMLFRCYNQMSDIAGRTLHPKLFEKMKFLLRATKNEREDIKEKFGLYLDILIEQNEIPIVSQTDRETRQQILYRIRKKTVGSSTLKAVDYGICDPEGIDFDPEKVHIGIHDFIGAMLILRKTYDAVACYSFIRVHYPHMIVEDEEMFYGRNKKNTRSTPDYKGVAHVDYDARFFGGKNIRRVELQLRSFESFLAYYLCSKAGRGARDSKIIGDAWGDDNYKIVEALGALDEIDNGAPTEAMVHDVGIKQQGKRRANSQKTKTNPKKKVKPKKIAKKKKRNRKRKK